MLVNSHKTFVVNVVRKGKQVMKKQIPIVWIVQYTINKTMDGVVTSIVCRFSMHTNIVVVVPLFIIPWCASARDTVVIWSFCCSFC